MIQAKKTLAILTVLVLTACATAAPKPLPSLDLSRVEPQNLPIGSVEVEPPPAYMNTAIPAGFIVKPAQLAHDYFKARYKAQGVEGRFKVAVVKSLVTHRVEASDNPVGNFLNVAKSDVYEIQMIVRLEALDYGPYARQSQEITATQRLSISEHVSLAERENLQVEAMQDLLKRLEAQAQLSLRDTFRMIP